MSEKRNGAIVAEQNDHQETTALVQESQPLNPAAACLDRICVELMR